jgi:hypothetical protein
MKLHKTAAILLVLLMLICPGSRHRGRLPDSGEVIFEDQSYIKFYDPEDALERPVERVVPDYGACEDFSQSDWVMSETAVAAEVQVLDAADMDIWKYADYRRQSLFCLVECRVLRVAASRYACTLKAGDIITVLLYHGSCHMANYAYDREVERGDRYVMLLNNMDEWYYSNELFERLDIGYLNRTDEYFVLPTGHDGSEKLDLSILNRLFDLPEAVYRDWGWEELSAFFQTRLDEAADKGSY